MRVSDLARKTGTTTETVRHYTDSGLLQPVRDSNNGYRLYGNTDLRLLRFALKARSLGFTLADIQSLAEASRHGETPCGQVRTLIETRLQQVEHNSLLPCVGSTHQKRPIKLICDVDVKSTTLA